ncbi:MAG: phosphoglycerate dehydrogenase [Candidatus Omnitrophica bacterium]|nr:phosphoglycerate dehydrogenase [Candidatus Omnitrophota bacterium]
MKVLVCDSIAKEGVDILKNSGLDVVQKTGLKEDELIKEIKSYDGVIVRSSTKITSKVIEAAENLKVIGRAGVGLDNVDLETATKNGIIVMNTPLGNTVSTAEHTMALMLSLARNIPEASSSMRQGKWDRKKFMGQELYGKILGIVGLGRIGREVAKRALSFGMKVLAYDPYISEDVANKIEVEFCDYEKILKSADYITFHIPLTDNTYHMFSGKELGMVKENLRVINCSRGGVVDELALHKALSEKKIAGAALDVYEEEPPKNNPLTESENIVLTPHLGASTEEAQFNVAVEMAEQIKDALVKNIIRNAVNLPSIEPAVYEVLKPYLSLAEKLGLLLGQLIDGNVNRVEIKYSGEILEHNLAPVSAAFLKGFFQPALKESVNYVNAPVIAKEREISVEEVKSSKSYNFSNLIQVVIETNKGRKEAAGTMFSKTNLKIVNIDGYYLEVQPSGNMLVVYNEDKPGVIGHIGNVCGSNGINISGMTFGREKPGGNALMVLNLDAPVGDKVIKELLGFKQILAIKEIKL